MYYLECVNILSICTHFGMVLVIYIAYGGAINPPIFLTTKKILRWKASTKMHTVYL